MASLTVTWEPSDQFTPVTCQSTNDLPAHVKGTAYWLMHSTHPSSYYYEEPGQTPVPVKFINNAWYILHYSHVEQIFRTCESYQVDPNDQNVGLGRWYESDPAHPNNQSTQVIQVQVTNLTEHQAPTPAISESESDQHQTTWGPEVTEQNSEDLAEPNPLDKALAATLAPIVSLQGSLPLDPPIQPTMTVNATTTMPANLPPPSGGLWGVPPTIFDGM